MKNILYFLFILHSLLITQYSFSQTFEWAKSGNFNGANRVIRDNFGNLYVAGGQFVAKYDSVGNFIWEQSIIAFYVKGIIVDTAGNLYATGAFGNTFDTLTVGNFTIIAENESNNMYLAKFDSNGIVQWLKQSHTNNYAQCIPDGMTIDKQGNPIVIGRFNDSLRLDSFAFRAPLTNQIFLAKYSPSGTCLWAKHLISESFDGGTNGPEIKSDDTGNTYISGHFIGNIQFDSLSYIPTPLTEWIFLTKINASGNFLWLKVINGSYYEESGPMDVDSLGNIYMSGYFDAPQANLGNYTLSTNTPTYFTAKYDTDGNCLWAKYGNANAICAVNDGYYTNAPGLITKYNSLGNFEWTKTVAGASNNAMVAVNTDVYLTGSYNGSVNFDTYTLNNTSNQMYIAKLSDPNPPIITNLNKTVESTNFSIFPNPGSGVVTLSINITLPVESFTINVTDVSGKIVYSENLKDITGSISKELNLSKLPKGCCFVELQTVSEHSQKRSEIKKIVLQ